MLWHSKYTHAPHVRFGSTVSAQYHFTPTTTTTTMQPRDLVLATLLLATLALTTARLEVLQDFAPSFRKVNIQLAPAQTLDAAGDAVLESAFAIFAPTNETWRIEGLQVGFACGRVDRATDQGAAPDYHWDAAEFLQRYRIVFQFYEACGESALPCETPFHVEEIPGSGVRPVMDYPWGRLYLASLTLAHMKTRALGVLVGGVATRTAKVWVSATSVAVRQDEDHAYHVFVPVASRFSPQEYLSFRDTVDALGQGWTTWVDSMTTAPLLFESLPHPVPAHTVAGERITNADARALLDTYSGHGPPTTAHTPSEAVVPSGNGNLTSPPPVGDENLPAGSIWGIVIGVLLTLALIALVAVRLRQTRRRSDDEGGDEQRALFSEYLFEGDRESTSEPFAQRISSLWQRAKTFVARPSYQNLQVYDADDVGRMPQSKNSFRIARGELSEVELELANTIAGHDSVVLGGVSDSSDASGEHIISSSSGDSNNNNSDSDSDAALDWDHDSAAGSGDDVANLDDVSDVEMYL